MNLNHEAILRSAEKTKKDIQEREARNKKLKAENDAKAFEHATGHVLEFIASRSNSFYRNTPTTKSVIWQGLRERLDKGSSKEMEQNKETKRRIESGQLDTILRTLVQKNYITQSWTSVSDNGGRRYTDEKELAYYYNRKA